MRHAPVRGMSRQSLLRIVLATVGLVGSARVLRADPVDLRQDVGFEQKLDAPLPLDTTFRDEDGQVVSLRSYFGKRPVVLTPVYYKCPMLCGLELAGLLRCLRGLSLTAGDDFQIVTYSIDPREPPELAHDKRESYLEQYDRRAAAHGWHFLTGDQKSIAALNDAIGFRAKYNTETGQYAHAAGIVVCTPQGRISRYLYGVNFRPLDLRLALVDASRNAIGTLTDQVLMYCYLYDPVHGRYGLSILRIVRMAGILTVLLMAGGIGWMLRQERRSARRMSARQEFDAVIQ